MGGWAYLHGRWLRWRSRYAIEGRATWPRPTTSPGTIWKVDCWNKLAQTGSARVYNWIWTLKNMQPARKNMQLPRFPVKSDHRGKDMYFRDDIASLLLRCAHKRVYFLHSRADIENFGKVGHLEFRGPRANMIVDPWHSGDTEVKAMTNYCVTLTIILTL